MSEKKKEVRNRWLHIRLNDPEYETIGNQWKKTTCRELSDYARKVLLKKPVTVNYRNQSADEILAEMIRLRTEIRTIADNFNEAVQKLQTLDTVPRVQLWLAINEGLQVSLLQNVEQIKTRLNQIYEAWSQE